MKTFPSSTFFLNLNLLSPSIFSMAPITKRMTVDKNIPSDEWSESHFVISNSSFPFLKIPFYSLVRSYCWHSVGQKWKIFVCQCEKLASRQLWCFVIFIFWANVHEDRKDPFFEFLVSSEGLWSSFPLRKGTIWIAFFKKS